MMSIFLKDDRKAFFEAILSEARMGAEPVLVFPEGYCTNNSHTIQFRKALFEESVRIFPIAIRQDTRLGDNYWSEVWRPKILVTVGKIFVLPSNNFLSRLKLHLRCIARTVSHPSVAS
jgi:hypothetical protein